MRASLLASLRVPAETETEPPKRFDPARVRVPVPTFVREAVEKALVREPEKVVEALLPPTASAMD